MAFSTSSKFVQITPYLLMEYMYADQPQPETYFVNTGPSTVGYDKLINGFRSGEVQIFNPNGDYFITHNTTQNSVVRISENSFVTLDSNLIIPFNDYTDELTNTVNLPIDFPSNLLVVYDTVRYHIRAGYNLGNIDGLIMSIEYADVDNTPVTVSQILIKKGTSDDYNLNPSPVTIGSNIYDKYIEIKIPNLRDMNNKYQASSSVFKPQTLAGLISHSGFGFIYNSPIRISAWQVQSTVDYAGYARYESSKIATLSLEQEDQFANIGATIRPSDRGEFFEFYATDNEGFIEDFILFQNSLGNSYYIGHQIEILEQIGASLIRTSHFDSIQTTAYDSPNYYRPIVRNASVAASFTLRYTMTLINSVDQSRTIRISSYTSSSPAEWGLKIKPIQLSNFPQVQKIYNRIYSQPTINMSSNNPTPREIVKYTNVFINQNYVTASVNSLNFSNNSLRIDTGASTTIAMGSGKLTIAISPFDTYLKFKFIKSGPSDDPVSVDLTSSGEFNISFIDLSGGKIQIPSLKDNTIANPALGEIAFKIDESAATRILQINDRRFFITNGVSINQTTLSAADKSTITVNAGTTNNVLEKSIESVISDRRDASNAISGANNFTNTAANNNILTPVNNSNSVMYWGYWKKNGEEDFSTGVTGSTSVPVSAGSTGSTGAPITEQVNAPSPSIKSILPASPGASGTVGVQTPAVASTNQVLLGSAKIAAISAEMRGYKAIGWADRTIVSYFLRPGKPGRIKYPNITKDDVIKAGKGILAPATIRKLRGGSFGNLNLLGL
jgi:hypothetical protein